MSGNVMNLKYTLMFIAIIGVLVGCNTKIENKKRPRKYEKDKIFLGYELGMTKKEFYDHSWKLNDKGLVRQGQSNQSVYYELDDELDHPAQMYFYPSFYDEKVYQMRVKFQYSNWAPWNKNLYSDSLKGDVIDLLKSWYGKGFRKKVVNKGSKEKAIHVKKDRNRKVIVTTKGSKSVVVLVRDILALKQAKKESKNKSANPSMWSIF